MRLGEHDLRTDPDLENGHTDEHFVQDFQIEKVIPHENYNTPNSFANDIALLRLDRKYERRGYVYPICLPFDDDEDEAYNEIFPEDLSERKYTEVAGWGATNQRGGDPADILQTLRYAFRFDNSPLLYAMYIALEAIRTQLSLISTHGNKHNLHRNWIFGSSRHLAALRKFTIL